MPTRPATPALHAAPLPKTSPSLSFPPPRLPSHSKQPPLYPIPPILTTTQAYLMPPPVRRTISRRQPSPPTHLPPLIISPKRRHGFHTQKKTSPINRRKYFRLFFVSISIFSILQPSVCNVNNQNMMNNLADLKLW